MKILGASWLDNLNNRYSSGSGRAAVSKTKVESDRGTHWAFEISLCPPQSDASACILAHTCSHTGIQHTQNHMLFAIYILTFDVDCLKLF